jgi:predicted transcriptional regulator
MSMILLKIIALTNKERAYDTLKKTTPHLTCKKYHSRLSRFTGASFIITQYGKYLLTSFGKVVHNAQMIVNTLESNCMGCNYYRCR